MHDKITAMLRERGVTLESIARLVQDLQRPYNPQLSLEECLVHVEKVIKKREVQNAVLTGLTLDIYAKGVAAGTVAEHPHPGRSLYGVDEVLALSITNIYGSIGFTTFGYLDKVKTGILENINVKREGTVNTFLDDLVAAIAAAAAARLAHH